MDMVSWKCRTAADSKKLSLSVMLCGNLRQNVADGIELGRLVQEVAGAGLRTGTAILRFGMVRQHDEVDDGHLAVDGRQHAQAAAALEVEVEQDGVGTRLADPGDRAV